MYADPSSARPPHAPPPVDPLYAEPPPDHRRTQALTVGLGLGLTAGLVWTLLTVPAPECGPGVTMCHLQRIHAAQLTKLALAALAGFLLGSAMTRDRRRHPPHRPQRAGEQPTRMDADQALSAMRARPRAPR